jgi:hypothetical protein
MSAGIQVILTGLQVDMTYAKAYMTEIATYFLMLEVFDAITYSRCYLVGC